MKKLGLAAVAACGICAASALIFSTSEPANAAGEWTKCVAWYGGETWNIVNGGYSPEVCFRKARQCTGNPNLMSVTHYGSPVIVPAPYRRCTL